MFNKIDLNWNEMLYRSTKDILYSSFLTNVFRDILTCRNRIFRQLQFFLGVRVI